jgi:hypothetical protein
VFVRYAAMGCEVLVRGPILLRTRKGPRQPTVECADGGANVLGDTPPGSAAISLPGDQSSPAVDAGTGSFPSQSLENQACHWPPTERDGRSRIGEGTSCK